MRTRHELQLAGYGGLKMTRGDHRWGVFLDTTPDAVQGVPVSAVMVRGVSRYDNVWYVSNPAGRDLEPLVGTDVGELLAFC